MSSPKQDSNGKRPTVVLQVRVRPSLRWALNRAAKAAGLRQADFLRQTIERSIKPSTAPLEAQAAIYARMADMIASMARGHYARGINGDLAYRDWNRIADSLRSWTVTGTYDPIVEAEKRPTVTPEPPNGQPSNEVQS